MGTVRTIRGLVLAVCFLEAVSAAAAQWVPIGPDGGAVSAVVAAPNGRTLFAAAGTGLFRSTNRGRSWTPAGAGLLGYTVELQMGTTDSSTAYALTTQGVFATFDGALSWSSRSQGLPLPTVAGLYSLTVVPRRPSTVFLLAIQYGYVDLYRSLDSGLHWSRTKHDLVNAVSLVPHPTNPQVIYAGTAAGIYRSTDTGAHWSPWSLANLSVFALAIDAKAPDRLYAYAGMSGHSGPPLPTRLYVTANGGRSWSVRHDVFDEESPARLAPDPTRAGALFVATDFNGLFRTTDAGFTWSKVGLGAGWIDSLAFNLTRPGVLYAACFVQGLEPGLLQSVDDGATFHPSATGIQAVTANALVADPTAPGVLYAGIESGGLLRYADGRWTSAGLDDQSVSAVALDPTAPGTIYASAGTVHSAYGTTDGGATWHLLSPADVNGSNDWALSLAVLDGVPYSAGSILSRFDPATSSWVPLVFGDLSFVAAAGSGSTASLWYDDAHDRAAARSDSVFLSTDSGASFRTVLEVHGLVQAIAPAPLDPQQAIVAWSTGPHAAPPTGGVFVTRDGGATWTPSAVAADAPPVLGAAVDPADPMHLAVSAPQVFASRDGGETWSPLGTGLPPIGARAIAFDSGAGGRLYAAPPYGGVYVLTEP